MTDGTTYYFAVAALNGTTASAYSAATLGTEVTNEQQPVSVLTYNILEGTTAGRPKVVRTSHRGPSARPVWSR